MQGSGNPLASGLYGSFPPNDRLHKIQDTLRKFKTLVSYLKAMGISLYNVNAANFDPQVLKTNRVRPDASERMRSAFEAKAHADWVREKVAESLAAVSQTQSLPVALIVAG